MSQKVMKKVESERSKRENLSTLTYYLSLISAVLFVMFSLNGYTNLGYLFAMLLGGFNAIHVIELFNLCKHYRK